MSLENLQKLLMMVEGEFEEESTPSTAALSENPFAVMVSCAEVLATCLRRPGMRRVRTRSSSVMSAARVQKSALRLRASWRLKRARANGGTCVLEMSAGLKSSGLGSPEECQAQKPWNPNCDTHAFRSGMLCSGR